MQSTLKQFVAFVEGWLHELGGLRVKESSPGSRQRGSELLQNGASNLKFAIQYLKAALCKLCSSKVSMSCVYSTSETAA